MPYSPNTTLVPPLAAPDRFGWCGLRKPFGGLRGINICSALLLVRRRALGGRRLGGGRGRGLCLRRRLGAVLPLPAAGRLLPLPAAGRIWPLPATRTGQLRGGRAAGLGAVARGTGGARPAPARTLGTVTALAARTTRRRLLDLAAGHGVAL